MNFLDLFSDWVLKLGPATFGPNGDYEYAVVTDSLYLFLFVLTRDPVTFKEKYEKEVLSFLANNGFDYYINEPVPTYQGSDCIYPPMKHLL